MLEKNLDEKQCVINMYEDENKILKEKINALELDQIK